MKLEPGTLVMSKDGSVAMKVDKRTNDGWLSHIGVFYSDQELERDFVAIHSRYYENIARGYGASIDPPEPVTEFVPWHEAWGRVTPEGGRITGLYVDAEGVKRAFVDHSIANTVFADENDMIEVRVQ